MELPSEFVNSVGLLFVDRVDGDFQTGYLYHAHSRTWEPSILPVCENLTILALELEKACP